MAQATKQRLARGSVRRMTEHPNKFRLDIAIFRDLWPDYFIYGSDRDDHLAAN